MLFCSNCGAQLSDEALFCPSCGAPVKKDQSNSNSYNNGGNFDFGQGFGKFNDTPDETGSFLPNDIAANKGYAILSYLGLLVLIPVFFAKNSPYARYHANQGLVLLIAEAVCSAVVRFIPWVHIEIAGLNWVLSVARFLVGVLSLVFIIIGISNAATGKAKQLPLIGGFKILN
ncbi:MAG: zinc-ribbon domain-containing protein [Clostridiales bacterium]|nr:zinc-ribbon domain-containing protein [Clostridiales bacterium]